MKFIRIFIVVFLIGIISIEAAVLVRPELFMNEISMQESLEIIESGDKDLILYGYNDCGYCQKAKRVIALYSVLTFHGADYVITNSDDKKNFTDSQMNKLKQYVYGNKEEEILVPLFIYTSRGKIVDYSIGTGNNNSFNNKGSLMQNYRYLFKEYLGGD